MKTPPQKDHSASKGPTKRWVPEKLQEDVFAGEGNLQGVGVDDVSRKDRFSLEKEAVRKSAAPRIMSDADMKDCVVLCDLILINQDAVQFYKKALEITHDQQASESFSSLQSIHQAVIENLSQKVISIGSEPGEHASERGYRRFFSILADDVRASVDSDLLGHIVKAEDLCLEVFEDALDEGVSIETQTFLAEQIGVLSKGQEYIKALGVSVRKQS